MVWRLASVILALGRLRQDCSKFEVGLGYRVSQACECDSLFQNKSDKKKHHSSRSLAQQALVRPWKLPFSGAQVPHIVKKAVRWPDSSDSHRLY